MLCRMVHSSNLLAAGVDASSWWHGLTTVCWRSGQRNEEVAASIGETSTKTSCRRPGGKQEDILRRLFGSSAGSLAAFPGIGFGRPGQSRRTPQGPLRYLGSLGLRAISEIARDSLKPSSGVLVCSIRANCRQRNNISLGTLSP